MRRVAGYHSSKGVAGKPEFWKGASDRDALLRRDKVLARVMPLDMAM